MPKIRTIYNPGVAMVYIIQNTQTGELINSSTCGIKDVDFKPWRSPKGTPIGKEFFKVKVGNKRKGFESITFLNSSIYDKCLSEDGEWEFIGKRPNGGTLRKLADMPYDVKGTDTQLPIVTNRVISSIEKIQNNNLSLTTNQIHQTIESEEFVDMDEMNKILK
jgi:hypothetical protein